MARLTIYVPDRLSERMAQYRDRLNLSAVCQAAIERAVEAEERLIEGDQLARLVARLQITSSPEERIFAEGVLEGRLWAETVASWPELVEVSGWPDAVNSVQIHEGRVLLATVIEFRSGGSVSFGGPQYAWGPRAVPRSFDGQAKALILEPEYWGGFVAGAKEVHGLVHPLMTPSDAGGSEQRPAPPPPRSDAAEGVSAPP